MHFIQFRVAIVQSVGFIDLHVPLNALIYPFLELVLWF